MEELKKRWGDQEKKKMAIKMGGGGAGIGAVVLLGGALATAALASAFILTKKGRSSGKDGSRRRRQSQDSPPEINKQNKEDEGNKGEKFIFLDQPSLVHKHTSDGETKEVEQDNGTGLFVSTESLKLDEKARDEINGGTQSDVYDDDFVIIEDKKLSLEPQIMMQEDEVKTELNKEDGCNKISQESKDIAEDYTEGERAERELGDDRETDGINLSHKEATEITVMQSVQEENTEMCYDQEEIEVTVEDSVFEGVDNDEKEVLKNVIMEVKMEEKEWEGFCSDNGEINEKKCEEAFENSETTVSESHGDDGKEVLPVFESQVIEEKNLNGDEKEGNSVTGIGDIIQIDEVKCIEKLVKEEDKCDQIDGIVVEKGEEERWTGESNESNTQSSVQIEKGEKKIDSESKEDDATIGNPELENGQFGVPVLEKEVISHEVTKENGVDVEEIAESVEVNKDETSMIGENLEEDEEKTAIVAENQEEDGEKIVIVAESLEVNEDEASMVAQNLEVDKEKIALVAESLEVNEEETSMVAQNLEMDEEKIALVAESLEVNEDKTSKVAQNLQVHEEKIAVVAESLEVNEDETSGVAQKLEVDEGKIAIVAESLELNEDETSMVAQNLQVHEEKIAIVAESLEVKEDETSVAAQNLEVDEEKIAIVAESPEVKEDESSMAAPNLEVDKEKITIVTESPEVKEDETSMAAQNLEVDEEKIAIVAESLEVNEEKIAIVAESPEVNEDDCQPKDEEDDSKENIAKKVEEELISPKDTAVINELNDNEIPKEKADNCQPKDHEDDMEGNIVTEVDEDVISPDNIGVTKEDSENEEVEVGIAKAEDDMIMETSEDEEQVTSEDEEKGEANLSDEVKEDSVGTGDSSTESNSEAIWPAESLQETSVEPEKKLIDQEVEGKIQEDKPVEESEYNSQDPYQVKAEESDSWKISANQPTQVVSSQFRYKNGDSDKTFVKKYAVNSTRWRMLIGALFVVSSLSCSWFFGLSFIKLGLIVFLTMVLSKIHG